MTLSSELKQQLALTFHEAPEGMHYEVEEFNTKFHAIWICYDRTFDYNLGEPVRCIWGFIRNKDGAYIAPINAKKPGKVIEINDTRPWTAMPLKRTPLEALFYE